MGVHLGRPGNIHGRSVACCGREGAVDGEPVIGIGQFERIEYSLTLGKDGVELDMGCSGIGFGEDVVIFLQEDACHPGFGIEGERSLVAVDTQVVQSGTVVEMDVGEKDGCNLADIGPQCLIPEIGAAVDEDAGVALFDQN